MATEPKNRGAAGQGQRVNGRASPVPSGEEGRDGTAAGKSDDLDDAWRQTFGPIREQEYPQAPLLHRTPVPGAPPKTSSIAPVAADSEPTPAKARAATPQDLLPRIVTVTFAASVLALFAVYTIRRPPQVSLAEGMENDVENMVAGAQPIGNEPRLGDLGAPPGAEITQQRLMPDVAREQPAPTTASGDLSGFDLPAALASLDDAEQRARTCWTAAALDRVTLAVRFVPEGYAVSADVKDANLLEKDAVACFEHAFRRTSVPPYTGEETTLWRTVRRP